MNIRVSASHWLLGACVLLAGCGSANASSEDNASSGAGGSGAGSSGNGGGGSSGGGSQSGNGSSGDYASGDSASGSGDDSGIGDDATAGSGSGGSGSSGTSSGGGGCSALVQGSAPTSDDAAKAGPFQYKSYAADATVRKTTAYDVTSSHIYYPTGAPGPYRSIAIVPGFLMPETSIADWGPFLASWGFVVQTFGTSNSTGAPDPSVNPDVRAAALLDALVTLRGENARSGSPLAGMLDVTRQAVAGWSMGGGGTLEDAADAGAGASGASTIKAVFAMEPWNPTTRYMTDNVPSLIFAGTSDGLVGPSMYDSEYQSIPTSTPKMLYAVQGGTHWVSTSPTNSGSDQAPDTQSTGNVARFGLSWMKVFLDCDTRFRPFLLVKPSDAAEFDTTLM